jgi:hypothetical protein
MNNRWFEKITYFIIDTDAHALRLAALRVSMRAFPARDVVIFSDTLDEWQEYSGQVILVDTFKSIDDYIEISLSRLVDVIHTEFALVLHWDGFVLDAMQFSPHFLFYDYIGAPWPFFEVFNVGNSGFNLRSKRMINAVASLANLRPKGEPDDFFMCRRIRIVLESSFGIQFAPKEIASHFSVEIAPVRWPTFGFHGMQHLPNVYRNSLQFLGDNISKRVLAKEKKIFLDAFDGLDASAAEGLRKRIQIEGL